MVVSPMVSSPPLVHNIWPVSQVKQHEYTRQGQAGQPLYLKIQINHLKELMALF